MKKGRLCVVVCAREVWMTPRCRRRCSCIGLFLAKPGLGRKRLESSQMAMTETRSGLLSPVPLPTTPTRPQAGFEAPSELSKLQSSVSFFFCFSVCVSVVLPRDFHNQSNTLVAARTSAAPTARQGTLLGNREARSQAELKILPWPPWPSQDGGALYPGGGAWPEARKERSV